MGKPLDSDFDFEDDTVNENDDNDFVRSEMTEVLKPTKAKDDTDKNDKIEIDIVDDTPEKDRGKWVANDEVDGEPELPSDDEVKSYTKDVRKRIGTLTARMHAERRAKEEIVRQNAERDAFLRRVIEENNSLKGLVESGEKVLMGEHKGRLEGQLAQARSMYREASEAGDTAGLIAAQEKIALAISQIDRLSSHRSQPLQREEMPVFDQPNQQQVQVAPDPRAVEWAKRNPWFQRDDAMTGYALGLHKQMEANGIVGDSEEYYTRLDSEMRKRFPERFRQSPQRQGSVVASATRVGGRSANVRRVTLTESQARLARRLGLTNEQYAEQLIAEQENGNGKEFTHSKRG